MCPHSICPSYLRWGAVANTRAGEGLEVEGPQSGSKNSNMEEGTAEQLFYLIRSCDTSHFLPPCSCNSGCFTNTFIHV